MPWKYAIISNDCARMRLKDEAGFWRDDFEMNSANKSEKKRKSVLSIRYLFYDFVKFTAIPGYLWFRPRKIFISNEAKKKIRGGALLISNHISFSDPIVLMLGIWYRRHHFICTKDFFEGKSRLIFQGFHCIPINKNDFGMDSFRIIVEHLQNEELVSMFPEGHVNMEDKADAFKSGMVLMSVMSGKPILPIYLKKRKSFWHRSVIAVGEPVYINQLCGGKRPSLKQIDEIAAKLQAIEDELREFSERI